MKSVGEAINSIKTEVGQCILYVVGIVITAGWSHAPLVSSWAGPCNGGDKISNDTRSDWDQIQGIYIKYLDVPDIMLLILQPTELSPLHQAVVKDNWELVLDMINAVRLDQSTLPNPNQDNREQQINSHRSLPSNSNYDIINRKNKVCINGGVGLIISPLYSAWLECTTLCCWERIHWHPSCVGDGERVWCSNCDQG